VARDDQGTKLVYSHLKGWKFDLTTSNKWIVTSFPSLTPTHTTNRSLQAAFKLAKNWDHFNTANTKDVGIEMQRTPESRDVTCNSKLHEGCDYITLAINLFITYGNFINDGPSFAPGSFSFDVDLSCFVSAFKARCTTYLSFSKDYLAQFFTYGKHGCTSIESPDKQLEMNIRKSCWSP
jgi:hypothetical protein